MRLCLQRCISSEAMDALRLTPENRYATRSVGPPSRGGILWTPPEWPASFTLGPTSCALSLFKGASLGVRSTGARGGWSAGLGCQSGSEEGLPVGAGIDPRVSPLAGSSAGGAVLPDTSVAVMTDADGGQNRKSGKANDLDAPPAASVVADALAASRNSPMG